MKKKISLLLIAVLVLTGIATGCGTTQPTAAPTATQTPTSPSTPTPTPAVADTGVLPTPTKIPTLEGADLAGIKDAPLQNVVQKNSATDYMYMYFRNGVVLSASNRELVMKSGRYGFTFDVTTSGFKSLGFCNNTAEQDASGNATLVADTFAMAGSKLTMYKDGTEYKVNTGGGYSNYKLIRSGNVYQSFQIGNLYAKDMNDIDFRMEVSSSPNHFSIYYDMFLDKEKSELANIDGMTFTFDFFAGDPELTEAVWANGDENSGVVTLRSADGKKSVTFVAPIMDEDGRRDKLSVVDGNIIRVTSSAPISIKARSTAVRSTVRDGAIGLLVIPNLHEPEKALHFIDPEIDEFLEAKGIAPYDRTLKVEFDYVRGMYDVTLRPNGFGDHLSDSLERVNVLLANRYGYDADFLIRFKHGRGSGVGLVGTVPMLRDTSGNPMGIPFQVSKNWHVLAGSPEYNDGQWQEYYVNVFCPARKKVNYEFTNTYVQWGKGVYAASHAQLCLIGWSAATAGLWEEAALGNYTENICYCPGSQAFGQDVRGYMFTTNGTALNGFANNVGGMDFLVYWNGSNQRVDLKDLKIDYYAHGPNMSTVIYSGITYDGAIKVRYTARLLRADDFARIFHTFEYEFFKDVDASRIIFYTYGAEQYNEAYHNRIAYGNAEGLVKEFTDAELEKGSDTKKLIYITNGKNLALNGENPWISWLGTDETLPKDRGFGYADRGLVVREYAATLNGVETATPYLSIRSARGHHAGLSTNLVELGGGTDSFKAGDKVRGTVEIFVMPQSTKQYVGPKGTDYYKAIEKYAGTWQLVHYMATRGAVEVSDVTGATVEGQYPATLKSTTGNGTVAFTLSNGNGYAPIVIKGLSKHDGWVLEYNKNGIWISVAQYQERHGNDYWQCKYDPTTDTYELTYNVRLEHNAQETQFRLVQK